MNDSMWGHGANGYMVKILWQSRFSLKKIAKEIGEKKDVES
jgi:hypothetical protein